MHLDRSGTLTTGKAPEKTFTGDVTVSGYVRRAAPSRLVGATVSFAPGARTPWKTNPLGQTLVVTSGVGWAQSEGEETVEIRAGDVVWFPPGEAHWEGATPDGAMTYVAVQEEQDGRRVAFGARVTDEEYRKGPVADALRPCRRRARAGRLAGRQAGPRRGTRGAGVMAGSRLAPVVPGGVRTEGTSSR